jgi:hypothetical protein
MKITQLFITPPDLDHSFSIKYAKSRFKAAFRGVDNLINQQINRCMNNNNLQNHLLLHESSH